MDSTKNINSSLDIFFLRSSILLPLQGVYGSLVVLHSLTLELKVVAAGLLDLLDRSVVVLGVPGVKDDLRIAGDVAEGVLGDRYVIRIVYRPYKLLQALRASEGTLADICDC